MGNNSSVQYTYAIPVTPKEAAIGESQVYRDAQQKGKLYATLKKDPNVKTVQDAYMRSFTYFHDKNCLGTREHLADGKLGDYKWKTYAQVKDEATKLGSGFVNLELTQPANDYLNSQARFILVWARNREEWIMSDIACALYRLTLVPVYDTLGPDTVSFIFEQTDASSIIVSKDRLKVLVENIKNLPTLKNVVVFEKITVEERKSAEEVGLKVYEYEEVLKSGERTQAYAKVVSDDIYTINYTSGTTGLPKGVILTHGNQVATSASVYNRDDIHCDHNDVNISYLPLAHTLERTAHLFFIMCGGSVGFYSGDTQKILEDLKVLRPTFFVSVPRLFTRIYDTLRHKINSLKGPVKALALRAVAVKLHNLKKYGALNHAIYDRLVFSQMREALGGRVRIMLSGSAPIEPEIQNFLRIAFSAPLVEGYGQTETCAASFISHIEFPSFGHVGAPMSCCEYKVVDVPEMNYTSKDVNADGILTPRGEVCIRGSSCFKGYYKDAEKTAETLDQDGWVHSGDIGRINPDGSLTIIDRKKNIFKLAQGEYVASEKVENSYLKSRYITETFLYGDSFKSYTVVLAVANKPAIIALAKELNLGDLTFEEICKNKEIRAKVLADLNKQGKDSKINSFELAKQIHLQPESFGSHDLLTPTFKVIRHKAKDYYQAIIDELYELPLK